MISRQSELLDLVGDLRKADASIPGFDLEADSLYRYSEQLCLIQVTDGKRFELVDPLAVDSLDPLKDFLAGATVWMHGADFDMVLMRREFGILPKMILDTQIGARLLGMRKFGLADLVNHYFDVQLSKSSQKADWGRRPLSAKMIEYALNDVRYLLPMGEKIVAELREAARYDWFIESCEAARTRVIERDDSREESWRVRGAGKLDRLGLAFLRGLWIWRNGEARSWDRPTFMVATNRDLLEWSIKLASNGNIELPRHYRADRSRRFRAAADEVRQLPQEEWPERPRGRRRKKNSAFDRRLDELISVRDSKASHLDLEGSLIAPRSVLEQLAAEEAAPSDLLLNWQIDCLGVGA